MRPKPLRSALHSYAVDRFHGALKEPRRRLKVMGQELEVVSVPERQRYELRQGGRTIGVADAVPQGEVLMLPHVEVDPEFQGQGLGGIFVRRMLDDIRARGLRVFAICSFVRSFLRRHPEYADLQA